LTPETRARLEQLIAQWRDSAEWEAQSNMQYAAALDQCADELAKLLSSLEPPQAQEPCVFNAGWCIKHQTYADFCNKRRATPSVPPQEEQV
jgi:hypothetical protein